MWTLLVLNGYWLFVLAFGLLWLPGDDLLSVHVWAGYLVGVFVMVGFPLGFVSSRPPRSADFLDRPVASSPTRPMAGRAA